MRSSKVTMVRSSKVAMVRSSKVAMQCKCLNKGHKHIYYKATFHMYEQT